MKVVANRGASTQAPENTLPAFELAYRLGADGIEFDVQMTSDGELIVIHDEVLDRTTNGSGPLHETSWPDIVELDAGGWFADEYRETRVPRLAEVLALAHLGLEFELELKGYGALFLDRVLEMVDRCAPDAAIEFTSSNPWLLARLRRLRPTARVGLFTQRPRPEMTDSAFERYVLGVAETADVQVVHVWAPVITERIGRRLRDLGLEVHANDADDADAIAAALAAGADRISTTRIELAVASRRTSERSPDGAQR